MKNYKHVSCLFALLAVLLSNVMCAAVAYHYCALQWGGRYAGYSAPASTAFLLCIPYGIGVAVCVMTAWFFHEKSRKSS